MSHAASAPRNPVTGIAASSAGAVSNRPPHAVRMRSQMARLTKVTPSVMIRQIGTPKIGLPTPDRHSTTASSPRLKRPATNARQATTKQSERP